MISFKEKGDFKKLTTFFEKAKELVHLSTLDKYGHEGVNALKETTPIDTGVTAESWHYRINRDDDQVSLEFYNTNTSKGIPIVVLLQYGHATGTGGWVEGRDFINPALKPIFNRILDDVSNEVEEL